MWLQGVFFALSLILSLLFFLYGFNHYYLLNKSRRYQQPTLAKSQDIRPSVSIHLPIYNERYVIRRLVNACACMAEMYGKDKVNILLLDDSTDDTVLEINAVIEEYRKKNFCIEAMRRKGREGFKAGALQMALEKTPEEFIAILDADFMPPVDFLIRTIPFFVYEENLGIVQCRWGHLNRDFNILTKAVAIAIDIHFVVEQAGRYAAGLFQNFNGSGGVIRKKAILEAGGWQADTLAEDLDLSYRIQLLGYRVLYLKDIESSGEIPPTIPSFKKQQGRWACGTLRTARKILPRLLSNEEYGLEQRLQAFIHLTGYFIHPLMAMSFILTCLATFFNLDSNNISPTFLFMQHAIAAPALVISAFSFQNVTWFFLGPLIVLCTIAPFVSSISTLRVEKLSVPENLPSLLVLLMLGLGTSISNSLEAGKALFSNRAWEFVRTPKYADLQSKAGWKARKYQVALDPVWLLEFAFACVGFAAIGFAIWRSNLLALFILIPFTVAYTFVFSLTILQSRQQIIS